jgi:hypothetical protein
MSKKCILYFDRITRTHPIPVASNFEVFQRNVGVCPNVKRAKKAEMRTFEVGQSRWGRHDILQQLQRLLPKEIA